ncbi:glycosyltransferase [Microbacterium sp. JZ37]|uniref:glycosyltransferase n=1 Tax=Microbacterium sp. JZ37 TaxID=2654193 RepID=UPI002B498CCD|nr:glycosyltransferase [Microbacterium sp. JZ37]
MIVGYYNRRDVLDVTLDSILGQSFSNLELIVFDDASTDGTAEALAEYAARRQDARLRILLHEANVGFVRGLTDAIGLARGQYIAIQGSGDSSRPERIARQVELLEARPEVGVVGCWYNNYNISSGRHEEVRPNADSASLDDLMQRNFFTHGEVMFRRSLYDRVGGYRPEFTYVQDLDLWIRMRRLAEFATVPEVLYERYIRNDGVTSNPKKFARQVRFPVLARELSHLTEADQERKLELVRERGVESVVSLNHPQVQKKYIEHVRVLGWSGKPDEAVELARENVMSLRHRVFLVGFFTAYRLPMLGQVLRVFVAAGRRIKRKVGGR